MNNKKTVIALSAKMGAGKSLVSNYMSQKTEAENIKYSETLSAILKNLCTENTRKNLQDLSLGLRNVFGENILEKVVLEKIKNSKKDILILDGIRREEDFLLIKKSFNFYLIFIDVDEEVRNKRMGLRREKSDDKNKKIETFKKEERHNSETKEILKKKADFILDNNSTIEDLEKSIEELLEKIL
jgi:dephospho-CoA kinase